MFIRSLTVLFVLVAGLVLSGCADLPETIAQARAWRDHAAASRAQVAADLADLQATRQSLPDDAPHAPDLDAALARARAQLAALDAAVTHADLILAEMTEPTDALTQGAHALGGYLPAPARGPVVLGAALVAALVRAHQVRKGAGSIAASIQKALADPDFRAAFERHAATIRTIQTPTARRIVDETTRPTLLRSPI